MNKVLNDLKNYELRNTRNYDLKKGNVTRDLKVSEGPTEITKEFSELVEKIDTLAILPIMGGHIKHVLSFVRSLILVDETAKLSYVDDNLRRIGNMNKTLEQEALTFSDYSIKGLEAKFYMKYENIKQALKENKKAITEEDRKIASLKSNLKSMEKELKSLMKNKNDNIDSINYLKEEMHKKELELYEARMIKLKLGLRSAALKNVSEKNIVDMAKDINSSNKKGLKANIIGGMAHIAADIILAISLPVSKFVVTLLQIPLVFGKLVKALDTHIFKKLREKSENSRNEERTKAQIKNINKEIGEHKFKSIVGDEKDLAKQLEKIEKTEDKDIKVAFESSRRAQNVLCATPKGYLKMFKIKPVEDNERLESTAKFIIKQIKELPDEDKAKEVLSKEYIGKLTRVRAEKNLKQAQESKERIKAMLEVFGIDNADDFINDVKEYKTKKMEDLKSLNNDKSKMSNADKEHFGDRKNKLKERLVEAMKQKL